MAEYNADEFFSAERREKRMSLNKCDDCRRKKIGECKGSDPWEVIVDCVLYKPPATNADRIRSRRRRTSRNEVCQMSIVQQLEQ